MLNRIIAFALSNRLLIVALTALTVVMGVKTIINLPVDVFPDLNRPTVTVMTETEGLAPEEVELLVTRPLEMTMAGLAGVTRVRSTSGIGLSIIYIEFDWESALLTDRQMVAEKLATVKEILPPNVVPAIGPITSIMGEIMLVGITSETVTPMELRSLADWVIRPRLQSIPGVAQVISIGGGIKQFQILADPIKMRDFDISMDELTEVGKSMGGNTTGGFVEDSHEEYLIRNIGRVSSIEDIQNTVVKVKAGVPISLGQVAEIVVAPQVKRGDASINGRPGVIMSIQKQPGSNTVSLTRELEKALQGLQSALPPDVKVQELFKQANFIESAITNVVEALRDGAILVTIVLFLFLLNFRTTAITLTAIPLSFVVTALVLKAFGISINTMTLGGLAVAIGELVDDAIVDVENVYRRLRENKASSKPLPALQVIFDASSEVRNSIVIATIIVILVFIPLFSMSGIEGRLFVPLGVAYVVSILASLLVSLTVTPVLCSYLLPRAQITASHKDGALVAWLKKQDTRLLKVSLDYPRSLIAGCSLLVLIATISVFFMGRVFLPPFNEGTVTISLLNVPGTSLTESNRIGTIAENQIMTVPEVLSVGRRTGRAEQDEHAEGVYSSEIDVDLKHSKRSREEILKELRNVLGEIPGIVVNIGQPISHRLDHLLSGVRAQIALKIFGPDLAQLRSLAAETRGALEKIPGLVDLQIEKMTLIPQVQVIPNSKKSQFYGFRAGALTEWLETAFSGNNVGQILEGDKTFNIHLRLKDEYKAEPKLMERLLVDTPTGQRVPLGELAKIQVGKGPNAVNRENGQRRIVLAANTDGRDLGAVVDDVKRTLATEVKFPEGYFIELGGQFESQVSATKTIGLLSLISILGIYLVLFSHLGSGFLALQVMVNIPLALIGSVVAIYLSGGTFSIATLVGFVTLSGIASRNGIMMITHYLHLMAHEGEEFSRKMIIRGSLERLVPVLMTALTAGLALVPLILAAGEPGKEILHPMAVVILGGLVSSTILDIVVTPVIFYAFGQEPARKALDKIKHEHKENEYAEKFCR
jgi:CzcA family heavy metal efflux pump